jgi:hypothetical protein
VIKKPKGSFYIGFAMQKLLSRYIEAPFNVWRNGCAKFLCLGRKIISDFAPVALK